MTHASKGSALERYNQLSGSGLWNPEVQFRIPIDALLLLLLLLILLLLLLLLLGSIQLRAINPPPNAKDVYLLP